MSSLLKFAKLTAKIINVSRMNILDITAFFSEVKDGKFEGSLFDCFPEEITDEQMDQVKSKISFSPHIAGISVESRERMSREIAEKLISTAGIIH
jgi:phosphoglycerate dehydrogenase-like enzyme